MFNDAHPAIAIALGALLWVYLMATAVTAAISIARLSTNLAGVRINPQNQRRAMRARVSAAVLVMCWAWPMLLILWTASGRSSASKNTTVKNSRLSGAASGSSEPPPRTRRGAGSGRRC